MAARSEPKIRRYAWEKIYKAAVLEPNNARLKKCIAVVEKSLLLRLLKLTNHPADKIEAQAIVDALRTTRILKRERLEL